LEAKIAAVSKKQLEKINKKLAENKEMSRLFNKLEDAPENSSWRIQPFPPFMLPILSSFLSSNLSKRN
jgi:hypothetical protein